MFQPPSAAQDGGPDASSGGSGGSSGTAGTSGSGGGGGTAGVSGTGGTSGGDGGPVGPWWQFTTSSGCQSAGVPTESDRPTTSGSGASLPPFVLAIDRMRFGSANDDSALTPNKNAWENIGFDLDKTCTASSTCNADAGTPDTACKNSVLVPFDGTNCRDNEIGKLFPVAALAPEVGPLFGITEPDWNCALYRGEFSVLLKVSNYNGQPNDDSVRVDVYTSVGLHTLPNWTCTSGPGGTVPSNWFNEAPWLPSQHWTVAKSSLALNSVDAGTELPDAKYNDPAAYVRSGYLFASLPSGTEIWLDGENAHVPGFRILLHRGVLVGKLVKQQDGTWALQNGTIGGVVLPTEILSSFREIGFCENMCQAYGEVVQYLNTHQDMLSTTSAKLPNTPCDSLSIGIAFQARQATASAGDVVTTQPPVDCPEPRNPLAPRQGCVCPDGGGLCVLPDGGDGG